VAGYLATGLGLAAGLLLAQFADSRELVYGVLLVIVVAPVVFAFTQALAKRPHVHDAEGAAPGQRLLGAALLGLIVLIDYAAFTALAFQLVGKATTASSTRFTLFMAAVNVPVVYVLRLDGRAHSRLGVRGMLVTDALSNLVFAGLLVLVLSVLKLRRSSGDDRRIQAA